MSSGIDQHVLSWRKCAFATADLDAQRALDDLKAFGIAAVVVQRGRKALIAKLFCDGFAPALVT